MVTGLIVSSRVHNTPRRFSSPHARKVRAGERKAVRTMQAALLLFWEVKGNIAHFCALGHCQWQQMFAGANVGTLFHSTLRRGPPFSTFSFQAAL